MTKELRGYSLTLTATTEMTTETCCNCGVLFAMEGEYERRRRSDHRTWYCPNGHPQHYSGDSDAEKLRRAQARETALKDQLAAAQRDAEATRAALVRDRHRFANGVCPCCSRSFADVRRHMATQHPDYDGSDVIGHAPAPTFECSCGRSFGTPQGLAIHQGRQRREGWDAPGASRWSAHLTRI